MKHDMTLCRDYNQQPTGCLNNILTQKIKIQDYK